MDKIDEILGGALSVQFEVRGLKGSIIVAALQWENSIEAMRMNDTSDRDDLSY